MAVAGRASWAGESLAAKQIPNGFASNETRPTFIAMPVTTGAPGWREGANIDSVAQPAFSQLWPDIPLSASRTRLPFLSALASVNALPLSFDSTTPADITLFVRFSDISQGAVLANPVTAHTPPNACQGATLQHGLQSDITPIPGAIIIPPQPYPQLVDPAIISSTWFDCQGQLIEQWHCYIYGFVGPPSPPRGKFLIRTHCLGCNGVRG